MRLYLALLILCSSTNSSADLFEMGLPELCNLINGHELSDMRILSDPESDSIACNFGDRNYAFEGSGYSRTFRVLRYFRRPELAKSFFLKFEGVKANINDPKIRSEFFSILETLLNGVSSNHKVLDEFIHAAKNLEPNNSVHVNLDAMSIGYRVYNYGFVAVYRLEVQNQCMFSLSDTVNRSQCLKERTSKVPTIVSTDSK